MEQGEKMVEGREMNIEFFMTNFCESLFGENFSKLER
jgi:hypothetical protein